MQAANQIASSKVYRFSVGPFKREFAIHSALVETQSPILNTFVNNANFKEAVDGRAELKNVDEQTFAAFVEYAYTGTYSAASTTKFSVADDDSEHRSQLQGDFIPHNAVRNKSARKAEMPKLRQKLLQVITDACPRDYRPRIDARDVPHAAAGDLELLLYHVRIYIFAECYGVSRLMDLSFYNLGQMLVGSELRKGEEVDVEDLAILLRYCYDEPAPETLKLLLLRYTACNLKKVWKSGSFQKLLLAHHDVAIALLEISVEEMN
ncbi:hypothetical protein VTI28DRAFT_10557 [Corynascus sepedonium]